MGERVATKKGNLLPVCVVCEKTPPGGIAAGIFVSGCFLCSRCEREIVRVRAGDRCYFRFKEKLKRLWQRRRTP